MAGVASAVTIVSAGISSIYTPTYGLMGDQLSTEGFSLSALSIFPSTIQEKVEQARSIRDEALLLLHEENVFDDIEMIQSDENESIMADIAEMERQDDESSEESESSFEKINIASEIYHQILDIYLELLIISEEFHDEEIRQKLLLDLSIHEVQQFLSEVENVISQLNAANGNLQSTPANLVSQPQPVNEQENDGQEDEQDEAQDGELDGEQDQNIEEDGNEDLTDEGHRDGDAPIEDTRGDDHASEHPIESDPIELEPIQTTPIEIVREEDDSVVEEPK